MKQKIHYLFMLLLMIIVGAGGVKAEDFTLSSADEITQNGITVSFAKGSGSNPPAWYTAGLRFYANNTITISSENNISSVTFNWEKQGSKAFASVTASVGDYSHPTAAGEGVWSGSAKSITFTIGTSGQLQLNTFSVIVEGGTPAEKKDVTLSFGDITEQSVKVGTTIQVAATATDNVPVTYTSGDENIATVDNNGVVTGVSVGETTITASFAGDRTHNEAIPVSYNIIVQEDNTKSATYVFNTAEGIKALGLKVPSTGSGTDLSSNKSYVVGDVSLTTTDGTTPTRVWNSSGNYDLRVYQKGGSLTFSVPQSYNITQIEVNATDANLKTLKIGENFLNTTKGIWSGSSKSVTITANANAQIKTIAVTYEKAPAAAVESPNFSPAAGTYFESQTVELICETDGATIKYSTDGENWIDYSSAITISETTTLYAKAVKGEDESAEVSATYTIAPTYANNQAANVAATSTETDVRLTITNAIVVYKNGQNTYLKDDTGGFLVYGSNNLNVGDKVTGHVDGKLSLYNGLPEIKEPTFSVETVSSDNEVAPIVVDAATLKANPIKYISQYVQVKPAAFAASEFTNKNVNITVGETELVVRNNFNIKASFNTESSYVVAGFVTIYNEAVQLYPTKAGDIVEIPMVAQIGTQKYETLEAAFAAVKDNETVTMLTDVTLADKMVLVLEGKAVTLDLGGKTLNGRTNLTSGSLTVKNGTVNCEGGQPLNVYGSATAGAKDYSVLTIAEDVTVSGAYGVCMFGPTASAKAGYGAVVNVAGTLNGTSGTVFVSGNLGNNIDGDMNNVINITGKVNGNDNAGVALNGNATVNVKSGAEITGNTGIAIKRGVLNVEEGAMVHGTGAENLTPDPNNNGTEMTGAAVSMTDTYNNYGAMSVNITGGTFISDNTVALFKKDGNYTNAATYAVSGGTFSSAVPAEFCAEGYIPTDLGEGKYGVKKYVATPIIFHDSGEYEGELQIAMAGEGTIMYTLNGGEAQTYSAPFTIKEDATIEAWAVKDGVASDVTEPKTFTIKEKAKSAVVEDGYYTIQNNDGKYVNVAGRKTVTLVSDTKSAGTVIRVKADEDGVKVLRSQAVDLPRYAERAMSYVPEIVKEVVKKLAANVDDPIIGEQGADLILDKFKKEFDYHLYLEGENNTYRIYGRTPSMKPVVDFYAENKELVDSRLLKVEGFVKEVLQKVVDKVGRGQSVVDMFKVKTIWQNMGGTLTEPTDDASTLKFYEEVLSSETNVWNFAYQTGMLYWEKVKGYLTENAGSLGDYGKYIEKIPHIRPNFKYYIVPGENGVDIISEGNSQITEASTAWTLTKREGFDVTFDATLSKNNGKEMYKTLYVDFAYKLPENVKALKVESVSDAGVAVTKEITGVVPAQTPVLLMSTDVENLTMALTLSTADGAAVTNELKGNDWLINKYKINTPELETIFAMLTKLSSSLGEKYEYLKRKNSGTVNNKYFFGLSVPTKEGDFKEAFMNGKIKVLTNGEKGLGFYSNFDKNLVGNEVFMFSEDNNPILLTLKGDVNRDGSITIADVTALVNIILGKATYPADADKYDFEAAHVNADEDITIADVTALVNIILGKTQN